jgi:hypothetical protein
VGNLALEPTNRHRRRGLRLVRRLASVTLGGFGISASTGGDTRHGLDPLRSPTVAAHERRSLRAVLRQSAVALLDDPPRLSILREDRRAGHCAGWSEIPRSPAAVIASRADAAPGAGKIRAAIAAA